MRRFLSLLLVLVSILSIPSAVSAAERLPVEYFGPPGRLQTALTLYPDFYLTQAGTAARVIVANGALPDPASLAARVRAGSGLLLVMGPAVSRQSLETLLGVPVDLSVLEQEVSAVSAPNITDPLTEAVIWTSAPQISKRAGIRSNLLQPLVVSYEDQSVLLGSVRLGQGEILILSPYLNAEDNLQFQDWAYFNYLVYYLAARLGSQNPLSFGAYPASPVPHLADQIILLGALALVLAAAILAFLRVRRYSLAHPEELDSLVIDRQEYHSRQETTAWDEIGFHRPLGGFMLAFMMGVVVFIPLIIYQNMILPAFILPSAQALGIWGRVTQFFSFLWQFFDMGTAAAFVKYFAEYRVHDPRKGIQFGQVYVWWQLLSGAIQVAVVATVASTLLPESSYALYAWSIIIHALIQIPGFLGIMRLVLSTYQRSDYSQILTLATEVILPILVQPVFVTIMVVWGQANPIFGASMGGLLGLGISAYFVQLFAFFIGLWLYRRLGYSVRVLFLAHFDLDTVRKSFRFGIFEMLGSVAWAIGQAAEIVVTQTRLVNYAEIWGNWGLAQNFVFSFGVVNSLYDNLMPSISEAISNGRKLLSQYYSVMAYKWGGLISGYIAAVLLAVADRFILGASGPQFGRAAVYAIPLIFWGAIQYLSWVGDNVQLGANRPFLKSMLVGGEQIIRIILAIVLIDSLQVNGLIIAYFIGLMSKGIVAYFVNDRVCFKQRFYYWQSLFAPVLAAAVHYLALRWFTGLIWQNDQVTSVLIFLIGILISYPVYAFLYGAFGGWDQATLDEVRQSVELSSFMRPMAWLFWKATALGAQISPLHGRFPIGIREQALQEARLLQQERVNLA